MDVLHSCRVFLVRHARTALNADGRLRGRLDPPLDDVGQAEAAALAATMSAFRPARVVCSPLRRAVETAQALAAPLGLGVVVDAGLVDRDYGRWAGHREAAVVAEFGSLDRAPGIEAAALVIERGQRVLDAQREHLAGASVVLVSHDAVNKLLLGALCPDLAVDQIRQPNACWNVLAPSETGWQVEAVGQTSA